MLQERLAILKEQLLRDVPHLNPKFVRYVAGGTQLFEQNMAESAESYFSSAVEADPQNPLARELWGYSHLAQKGDSKKEQAIEILGVVTYLAPNMESYRSLAFALATYGKYHPYQALLRNALQHKPDDDLLIRIGRISVTQGMTDLTKKVQKAMQEKELYVKLYPL